MVYQYRQGSNRVKTGWIVLGIVALVLASPWLANQLNRAQDLDGADADTARKLYDSALDTGWQAAVAVQTAQTQQEWESVIDQWDQAINLLQTVKQEMGDKDGVLAQKKTEYEQYREYALQKSAQQPPAFNWEVVTELAGDKSYILVDPDTADAQLTGPLLELGADHIPKNIGYINRVLQTIGLPPIGSASQIQVQNDHQYRVSPYPAGELVLYRSQCSQSFAISDKYDCLWKITLQKP